MMTVSSRICVPGALLDPIAGTIRWVGDKAVGVWGDRHNAVVLHIMEADGSIRPANRAERRMADRMYPEGRR